MSIKSTILVAALYVLRETEAANTALAQFGDNGLTGFVATLNGFVWMDLDFSGVDWTQFPENCTVGGLQYHVHDKWTHGETLDSVFPADRILSECGPTYTGGHYDPWYACGPSSGNAECNSTGSEGCITPSTIYGQTSSLEEGYICTPQNYSEVVYNCEIGDWSGKYGLLQIDNVTNKVVLMNNDTVGSYWEPSMEALYGVQNYKGVATRSIVIHCNDGERAFCAPILRGQASEQQADLSSDQVIETSFADAGADFAGMMVKFRNDGGVPAMDVEMPGVVGGQCATWAVYLYADWPYEDAGACVNVDLSELGGILDPTHSCIPDSSSPFCSDGLRCNVTSTTYSCSVDTEYFYCAAGDISGRIGTFTTTTGLWYVNTFVDPLSPPLYVIGNNVLVFRCMDDPLSGDLENVAALTLQTNGSVVGTPAPTDSDQALSRLSFVYATVTMVLTIAAVSCM
eukprot:CAMPEP_0202696972 /NCGR_PEP_ID=MMETSP1385-20130828/10292_1 /ASSEMBLY_ACC=CAM_ASM_000861 /TAXON_ID=933848 /ORGANISM="Elphidium margaritaceum" /LENGTH=455 /DNA_ID=CAMNT_0049353305 /DNA_START=53 /DNA_END=1420 /DNA_ORIENTATION=-